MESVADTKTEKKTKKKTNMSQFDTKKLFWRPNLQIQVYEAVYRREKLCSLTLIIRFPTSFLFPVLFFFMLT